MIEEFEDRVFMNKRNGALYLARAMKFVRKTKTEKHNISIYFEDEQSQDGWVVSMPPVMNLYVNMTSHAKKLFLDLGEL